MILVIAPLEEVAYTYNPNTSSITSYLVALKSYLHGSCSHVAYLGANDFFTANRQFWLPGVSIVSTSLGGYLETAFLGLHT